MFSYHNIMSIIQLFYHSIGDFYFLASIESTSLYADQVDQVHQIFLCEIEQRCLSEYKKLEFVWIRRTAVDMHAAKTHKSSVSMVLNLSQPAVNQQVIKQSAPTCRIFCQIIEFWSGDGDDFTRKTKIDYFWQELFKNLLHCTQPPKFLRSNNLRNL